MAKHAPAYLGQSGGYVPHVQDLAVQTTVSCPRGWRDQQLTTRMKEVVLSKQARRKSCRAIWTKIITSLGVFGPTLPEYDFEREGEDGRIWVWKDDFVRSVKVLDGEQSAYSSPNIYSCRPVIDHGSLEGDPAGSDSP